MVDPFNGIINDEFKLLHKQAITEVIRGCKRPCRLIFGDTLFTDCVNCVYDPIGKKSANRYQSGGPMPFGVGICPMCHGSGKIPDEQTENIDLCPIWDHREWIPQLRSVVKSPLGYVMTMSAITTYSSLKQAKKVIINTDIENYSANTYIRESEPEPCGFGNDDFVFVLWKRAES